MQTTILQNLELALNSLDPLQRSTAQQTLSTLPSHPDFYPSLSNIILNHPNTTTKLSTILYLKKSLLLSTSPSSTKQTISNLISLLKHPNPIKLKKILVDIITSVLALEKRENPGGEEEIRKIMCKQIITEFRGIVLEGEDPSWLEEVEYNLILTGVLIGDGETGKMLVTGVVDHLLEIGLVVVKLPDSTEEIINVLHLVTECLEKIVEVEDPAENTPFKYLCVSAKFEELIFSILKFFSTESSLFITNKNNTYTSFEELINATKSNALMMLTRVVYYSRSTIMYSPFTPRLKIYVGMCFTTLKTLTHGVVHTKYFKYQTLLKGVNEILKLLLISVSYIELYDYYSNLRPESLYIISRIIEFTPEEKDMINDSPEELLELIAFTMKGGSHLEISEFLDPQKVNEIPTRTIAGRLLIELLKYLDGLMRALFFQTCENILLKNTEIDDIAAKQRSILLLGVMCNCIGDFEEVREKVDDYIGQEIGNFYEVYQCSQNHKIQVLMKFVFVTLYHHITFEFKVDEKHCEELFELVEVIFEGKFQPALENPPILLASYDLLRSLLELNTDLIDKYTLSLLKYFISTLSSCKPTIPLLRSLTELCNQNKVLETLIDPLLTCLTKLITWLSHEMQQPHLDPNYINESLDVISMISNVKPVVHIQEWKAFFTENLLALVEYFGDARVGTSVEEKVLGVVVRFVRRYKKVSVEEVGLLGHGVEYLRGNSRLGKYYELVSLTMLYGEEIFSNVVELAGKVAEFCLTVFGIPNILPSETFKSVILLSQLLDISRRHNIVQPQFLTVLLSTLLPLYHSPHTQKLIKYNILAILSQIICCNHDPDIFSLIIKQTPHKIRSVYACKILIISFCQLIVKVQQSIPEMFALAISFVVYVCSFEGKVFKRGESDDEEEYEFEKEMVVENVFEGRWLGVFQEVKRMIWGREELRRVVVEGLTEFERVEVEKIERLRVTEHGIREIRRLR